MFFALFSTGFNKGLEKQQCLISHRRAVTYIYATPSTCRKPQAVATWSNWQENICLLSLESNKQKESPYVFFPLCLPFTNAFDWLRTRKICEINRVLKTFHLTCQVNAYVQRQSILWFKWMDKSTFNLQAHSTLSTLARANDSSAWLSFWIDLKNTSNGSHLSKTDFSSSTCLFEVTVMPTNTPKLAHF